MISRANGDGGDADADVESAGDAMPRMYSDADVESAPRISWLSGSCDCCLSIWATLGDAIEGQADMIAPMLLMALTAASTYLVCAPADASTPDASAAHAPPAPPSAPDWSHILLHASASFTQLHPLLFVATMLGGLVSIALIVLFEEELFHRTHRGYQPLPNPDEARLADGTPPATLRARFMRDVTLKHELHKAVDSAESLELHARLSPSDPGVAAQLKERQELRDSLINGALRRDGSLPPELVKAQSFRTASWACSCGARCMHSLMGSRMVSVFSTSLNGLVAVWLYFADLLSDVQVVLLLVDASKLEGEDGGDDVRMLRYAIIAASLLVLQFAVVYLRVLPYLSSTFGRDSCLYQAFLWLGFPFGMLLLDLLMFLEPFGLLPIAPISDRMRLFLPSYKTTRIIAEVMLESLPQCLLQSYILVSTMKHLNLGTDSISERALLSADVGGATFAEILPRSITISVVAMLKTWVELVYSARQAGISVRTKVSHLWHVGHGLPLDALKKGSITEWTCGYRLADGEVRPLLDALVKNSSLSRLDLVEAGLEWGGPDASKQRSGASLIEAMVASSTALAALQTLVVCSASGYEVPVAPLRRGGDEALAALRAAAFLQDDGPSRLEVVLMSDLLRKKNRAAVVAVSEVEESKEAVLALLEEARRGKVSKGEWESRVKNLMVAGGTRRAHFKSLVSAACLHDVGFSPTALARERFEPQELKEAGYTARELRAAGITPTALVGLGYTPRALREAGLNPTEFHQLLHSSAADLRAIGFSAAEMRAAQALPTLQARYPLNALVEAGYGVVELKEAGWKAVDLRMAGFTAVELRDSDVFSAQQLRDAGYLLEQVAPKAVRAVRAGGKQKARAEQVESYHPMTPSHARHEVRPSAAAAKEAVEEAKEARNVHG
jgi:hypothetical protein